ncbi:hypothetical protein [Streptomyces sp. B1I3]|uniref:hypothetical protein n=1 Tax=Streptomyces sp. B1I3 TaxID=3042264 RepID=UPI00278766F3|nr:hypothetical protein [Streptomyces sp. B1I3]MDQ0794290.1 hypothetical protein [Streptomyces sp. B1I3]
MSEDVSAVEALRTGPFTPPWAGCADTTRSAGGEDFAIVALRVSQDFYGADDDGESAEAAHEAFETERWGVVLALDERWGPHRVLATDAYAEREAEGAPVPPFHAALFELGYFGDLHVWDAGGGRTVGVGTGRMDREEPVVLFAVALATASAG